MSARRKAFTTTEKCLGPTAARRSARKAISYGAPPCPVGGGAVSAARAFPTSALKGSCRGLRSLVVGSNTTPDRQSMSSNLSRAASFARNPSLARHSTIAKSRTPAGVSSENTSSNCCSCAWVRCRGKPLRPPVATFGTAPARETEDRPVRDTNLKKERSVAVITCKLTGRHRLAL